MSPIQAQITELWGEITAATCRFLELVGELDATNGWADVGILSCAHWLNVYCGIGMVAARGGCAGLGLRRFRGIVERGRGGGARGQPSVWVAPGRCA